MKERNKNSNLELIGENEWGEEVGAGARMRTLYFGI
jgi:hypothetical protein